MNKPIIFIPIENTARELDYKINLARLLCNNHFDVMVGNPPFLRDELQFKNFKGAFFEKGANPTPEYYQALKNKEIFLYCLSDEGASHPAFSVTYKPAVDALKTMDHIFLWGNFQMQDLIQRNNDPDLIKKYKVTGYPGLEFSQPLYKSYHKVLKPKNLPESYILVNTNFGSYNGFEVKEIHKACTAMSPETKKMIDESYKREELCFKYFYEYIKKIIRNYPEQIFLIRPHPVENIEKYIKYFSEFKNVVVSKDGNVNQLISDAKLVIHSDCTTALQAYLMKVPAISLAHAYKDMTRATWALSFGAVPESYEEMIALINHVLTTKKLPYELEELIDKNAVETIEKMFGNAGESTNKIVSIISAELKDKFKVFNEYVVKDNRTFVQKLKILVRKFLPLHYNIPAASALLLLPYTKKDLKIRLDLLNRIENLSVSYNIKKVFPNTFYISSVS